MCVRICFVLRKLYIYDYFLLNLDCFDLFNLVWIIWVVEVVYVFIYVEMKFLEE